MKKLLGILILVFLLFLPLSASADYIETYKMDVNASGPNSYYGWLPDYDATITGIGSYEVFCVEKANMDGAPVDYDFYSIGDLSAADDFINGSSTPIDALKKSTWLAHQFQISDGSESDKADAQTAIWITMFDSLVGTPAPGATAMLTAYNGAGDKGAYVDDWLLAVNPSNGGTGIEWEVYGQNYLVPNFRTVPEPANMFLMGTGLLGLAALGRRKFFKR